MRVKWIDNYKGYLLLMVILGHIQFNFTLVNWSAKFFMPAFFMISGYLFSVKDSDGFKVFLKRKSKSLLIPYFFFGLWGMVLNPDFINDTDFTFVCHSLITDLYRLTIEGTATHGVAPMWFVYVLFQVLLLAYGLYIIKLKFGKEKAALICLGGAIFSFAIGWMMNFCEFKGPFMVGRLCTAFFYFEIGHFIRVLDLQLSNSVRFLLIFLLFILFYYGLNQSGIICNLVDNSLGSNLQAFLIVTLAGSWLSWIIVRLCSIHLPDVGLGYCLQYISKNAIVILPMHWWIYKVCMGFFPECSLLLSAIVVISLTVISVEVYNCWSPFAKMK